MNAGKVSVIMGVYNCASTLKEAIQSIQRQTYLNWELILCDDGSNDDTYKIAEEMAETDCRILLIRNRENLGLNRTLNRCLEHAKGQYIARMDGDDDCFPDRFAKQVAFLETHPEFAIVSTQMILFDENGDWGCTHAKDFPQPKDVACSSPICHAPVMMRRDCIEAVGGYTEDPHSYRVEDVDLWIRLYAAGYRCYNIQEPLYRMRNDQEAFARRKYKYRVNAVYVRLKGCRLLGLDFLCRLRAFQPMLNGLVPVKMRQKIRKWQQKKAARA